MTTLKAANVSHLFDVVVMSGDVECPKPDPRIFIHAITKMNLESLHNTQPRQIIFIGNETDCDIVGANGVGWTSCLLTSTEPNSRGLAHFEVNDFAQLRDILFPGSQTQTQSQSQ
jgi:FMN phosphatase YigB (HAD superfamily)